MDFNLGSMGVSLGLSGSNLGFGDRTLANLTSDHEMAENRSRMLAQGGAGLLLPSSHGVLKQSRSSSEVEVQMDSREESIGTLKLARSHSFSGSHGGSGLLIRNDHGRLSCSPSTSEDALLPSDNASPIAGEPRMISPSYLSTPSIRHLTYQQDPYFYKFPGMQMAMARENMNLYDAAIVGRYPFTSAQWAELEHQALIYKYIIHGYPIPEELLLPIRKSVAALTGLPYGISGVGWGSFNLGAGSSVDPEPGRCRRTDGKKWRCSRPVVPDQKYCERHMHRGRHRSRKAAEAQANSLSQPPPSPSSTSRSGPIAAPLPARANSSQHSSLDLIVQSPHSITQKPNIIVTSSAQQQYAGGSSLSTKALLHAPASASVTATSLNSAKCSSTSLALPNTHFQIPPHQSSLTACKDQRFVNGLSNLRAEQVLIASEAFRNPCSMMSMEQDQHQLGSRLSMVPSTRINPWPAQLSKMPSLVPQKPSNNSLYPYHSSLMSLQAQDMQAMVMQDASPLSAYLDQQQQQQQQAGYFSSKNNPNPIEDVKSENQPLRHFFDDWPRSRDSSTLSCWPSETDEEKHKSNANASSSSTQLSISITTASDLASANASPSRSNNIFSPLRLSMSRAAQDAAAPTDPTHMGLGMALGSNGTSPHNQSLWFPISCSMDNNPMGGPLAEALQSSTPLVAAAAKRSAGGGGGARGGGAGGGLNLLGTGEGGRHDISSPQLESSRLPSPTGVLQKTFGCCFSDSSSSASSPASAKPEAVACDQTLKAHLTCNGSPHVAT